MKNLIIVGFITLLFASCKKNELAQERYENDNKLLEQNAFLPTPVPAYKWTKLPNQFPNQYPF
ncbi:MAG: hypothetical protein ABJA37_15715, partial [Ferruginibacter sp.]